MQYDELVFKNSACDQFMMVFDLLVGNVWLDLIGYDEENLMYYRAGAVSISFGYFLAYAGVRVGGYILWNAGLVPVSVYLYFWIWASISLLKGAVGQGGVS